MMYIYPFHAVLYKNFANVTKILASLVDLLFSFTLMPFALTAVGTCRPTKKRKTRLLVIWLYLLGVICGVLLDILGTGEGR